MAIAFSDAAAAPAPLADAATYFNLLERLMAEGRGYGKTESVAAYKLSNLKLVTENADGRTMENEIEIKPLYVVMDLAHYPNEYVRRLVMEEVTSNFVRRLVGESDLNAPDFKGPGLWTAKTASFDFDYNRSTELDEHGRPVNVYNPNPDAYRVCLNITAPLRIPTQWGEPWEIGVNGTLAVRERDVPALAAALADIRAGRKTPEEALLETKPDGRTLAKFDVYGMMPGFLEDNYKPVFLKPETIEHKLASAPPTAPAAKANVIRLQK